MSGLIFNIQRFCTHDGPGIRTTVFLKGCSLSCLWCHNPESQSHKPQLQFEAARCLGYNTCSAVCPSGVLAQRLPDQHLHQEKCLDCGACAKTCPSEALQMVGKCMTVEEVISEVEKDRVFYEESGGGVTFSGGEPLAQGEFLYELLHHCRRRGLHSVMDTSGHAPWPILDKVWPLVDVFLYDIKHMDSATHQRLTGVPNDLSDHGDGSSGRALPAAMILVLQGDYYG